MNFDWNEKEKQFKDKFSEIIDDALREKILKLESGDVAGLKEIMLAVQKKLADDQWWQIGALDSDDAAGWDNPGIDIELARCSSSLYLGLNATRRFGSLLAKFGSEAAKAAIQDAMMAGEIIAGVAITEKGSKEEAPACELAGDGSLTLNLTKSFVANGPIADWLAVHCRVDGKEAFCLVKTDQAGVCLVERQEMMGLRGLAVCEVVFEQVKVEADYILGPLKPEELKLWSSTQTNLSMALASTGLMYGALATTKNYADKAYRGGKPLVAYQEVSHPLAEMLTMAQTSELLCRRAGWMLKEKNFEAETLVYCARVFTAESGEKVASQAMQIMAGEGYKAGSPVERMFRDAKGLALMGTSVEVSRMEIADELLSRY